MIREKIWSINNVNTRQVMSLVNELKISSTLALLLINRGYRDPVKARNFLNPSLNNLNSPFKMQGMDSAVNKIINALETGTKIVIFGDYDVDGITATALLVDVFRDLGAQVDYYIPDRLEEGYGLNSQALEMIAEQNTLVITVDCGISSVEEVAKGQALGLDFIITDHHQPPEILPSCIIINPALEKDNYPWSYLSGVGVAFKLAQGLLERLKGCEIGKNKSLQYLDLVALGTIADIVPLIEENRILVKYGLKCMAKGQRLGIKALADVANINLEKISSQQVGFILAPRLNACGRIGKASLGVNLLLSQEEKAAQEIAQKLNKANQERQYIESKITKEVQELVEKLDLNENPVIVLTGEDWHLGVIGIVASRLVEKFYRPVILLTKQDGLYKGSGRSIPGFHLYQSLQQCQELLQSYGGHSQAAGLSISPEKILLFRDKINSIAREKLNKENLTPTLLLDGEIDLTEADFELLKELKYLEPFGAANPEPVLVYRSGEIINYREVGNDGGHLKLKIKAQETYWDAIGFNMGSYSEVAASQELFDFAFTLDENNWNGKNSLQLILKDFKPHHKLDSPYHVPDLLKETLVQENVQVIDYRGCNDKIGYIKKLLLSGELTVIYINNEKEAHFLVRKLETDLDLKDRILYDYGDLSGKKSEEFWNLFHSGYYKAMIISNKLHDDSIPVFKNLVLYSLCFSTKEYQEIIENFSQNGFPVKIHLLYGVKDKTKNQNLLKELAPGRKQLALFYLLLKEIADKNYQICLNDQEIASRARANRLLLSTSNVNHWLKILEELRLLKIGINGNKRIITFIPSPTKVKLEQSSLFLEGVRKKLDFQQYLTIAFGVISNK